MDAGNQVPYTINKMNLFFKFCVCFGSTHETTHHEFYYRTKFYLCSNIYFRLMFNIMMRGDDIAYYASCRITNYLEATQNFNTKLVADLF